MADVLKFVPEDLMDDKSALAQKAAYCQITYLCCQGLFEHKNILLDIGILIVLKMMVLSIFMVSIPNGNKMTHSYFRWLDGKLMHSKKFSCGFFHKDTKHLVQRGLS